VAVLASRAGLRERLDLLAAAPRLAAGRGLAQAPRAAAGSPRRGRPDRLEPRLPGFGQPAGEKGGSETGPNPTDRSKAGSKRHLVVDRQGIPLAVWLTAANVHDWQVFEALIESVEPIARPRGRPRQRPHKLHADKAYDYPRCRAYLRRRGIIGRIARRGIDSSDKLGRSRWTVERTFAWINRFRRLIIRYERLADLHLAFLDLGCALICLRFLLQEF
jgi:transposase